MSIQPAALFCSILQREFDTTVTLTEAVLLAPLRTVRNIKNNIERCDILIYAFIISELDRLENLLIESLGLAGVNQNDGVDNWCNVAWTCRALVNLLVNQHEIYLPGLSQEIIDELTSNFDAFERYVCVLGMKGIINQYLENVLADIQTQLEVLSTMLIDNLRLDDFINKYQEILDSSGILERLEDLRLFLECGFGICNFAISSRNKIDDYNAKLLLDDTGVIDLNSILTKVYTKNEEINTRIDYLTNLIGTRDLGGVPKDKLVIF